MILFYNKHLYITKAAEDFLEVQKLHDPDNQRSFKNPLIQDALYYVETSNAQCYNPYWIFGSEYYEDILNKIWKLEVKELECDIYNL